MKSKLLLILVGFTILFLELALIRWFPANITSLAYFSNIILISSFVGLGIGFLLQGDRNWFRCFPYVFLVVIGLSIVLQAFQANIPNIGNEILWSIYSGNLAEQGITIPLTLVLAVVFASNASLFILLGQKMGSIMRTFADPLEAYVYDIGGSLLGIFAFTTLSFFGNNWAHPVTWFSIVSVCVFLLLYFDRVHVHLYAGTLCLVVLVLSMYWYTKDSLWSPYYRIDVVLQEDSRESEVFANRFFFQRMVDFTYNEEALQKYGIPYDLVKPETVLILGAGSGNDATIALINGAKSIVAVEIDKTIAELGKTKHPNTPYNNPQVHLVIDDARSHLASDTKNYDLIILGTLDAHALLSARSTVRLDNYVYTVESLQEVKAHLNEHGLAVLQFSVPEEWLANKIIKTVQTVFGSEEVVVLKGNDYLFNLMILAGPRVSELKALNIVLPTSHLIPESIIATNSLSTDDWPYLYLKEREISSYYVEALGVLTLLSFGTLWFLLRKNIVSLIRYRNSIFFFLGAGFLLLETKSITTLSLLFGSTWIVNSFVFAGILTAILIANLIVSRIQMPVVLLYVGLLLTILVNYLTPVSTFLRGGETMSLAAVGLVTLPIFFASMIFSTHLKGITDMRMVFGVNLIGALFGGLLEYVSMITGMNSLYVVVAGIYMVVFYSYILLEKKNVIK